MILIVKAVEVRKSKGHETYTAENTRTENKACFVHGSEYEHKTFFISTAAIERTVLCSQSFLHQLTSSVHRSSGTDANDDDCIGAKPH